ncbi:hypothetical protein [Mesorhizobium sp. WSM2239]|uniref:PLAT domain-containing protein n=2 Tax=unclassified Mesorhizobium TaxID=325217 RepID=A0AAU8DHX4_9HYPH
MTSQFHIFAKAVEARFRAISGGELYVVDAVDLFDTYLASFPAGSNPLFRERTEHDCSCCKNFIRNIGNVVAIKDNTVMTVWDVADLPHPYDVVAKALADTVRQLPIKSIFRTKEGKFGAEHTHELRDGGTHRWSHFFCDVPSKQRTNSPEEARGRINTSIGVFRRGLVELTAEALDTVIELIDSNAIYRGAEFKPAVTEFRTLHQNYQTAPDKEVFIWNNIGSRAALFRNTVIGTLVVDLSTGEELDRAVRSFETKVAPMNYKRPTALITQKMIDDGLAKLRSLGLESAVQRRFAKLSDVSVNNVLFVDNSVKGQMKDGLEGLLADAVKPAKVDTARVTDISMDDFLEQIVPQATSIDLLLQNKHLSNFMSITTGDGGLFKWDNGFAWSYDGDAADSIKQRVKRAGGNVDANLRVSLAWTNYDDLDLHVIEPNGTHIYYGNRLGKLDVDMNAGGGSSREPVENIVWNDRLQNGRYHVSVNNFCKRETIDVGFTLEVEFRGAIQQFSYARAVGGRETIDSLALIIANGELVGIEVGKGLIAGSASQDKWGVSTETLVPVNTLMASPNHWDGQGVGNKHWFFILKDCLNPAPARGIYNEFLKSELDPHRKVFEVLGSKTKAPVAAEQLSGVGFSSTRQDEATVVVKGNRLNKAFNIRF